MKKKVVKAIIVSVVVILLGYNAYQDIIHDIYIDRVTVIIQEMVDDDKPAEHYDEISKVTVTEKERILSLLGVSAVALLIIIFVNYQIFKSKSSISDETIPSESPDPEETDKDDKRIDYFIDWGITIIGAIYFIYNAIVKKEPIIFIFVFSIFIISYIKILKRINSEYGGTSFIFDRVILGIWALMYFLLCFGINYILNLIGIDLLQWTL